MDLSSDYLVTKEQETLETFFWHLGQFAYEKGKDVVEKERDAHKSQVHSIYADLMSSLSQLALAEKNYSSLLFLVPKGFLRKDSSLKSMYETLLSEFQRLEERSNSNVTPASSPPLSLTPPPTFYPSPASGGSGSNHSASLNSQVSDELEKLSSHLCGQLAHFVIARLGMMEFYEKMWSLSSMQFMKIDELLANITEIINAKQKLFHHPYLSPLKSSFNYECETLHQLLMAQIRIQQWQFLPSLLHLHDAHSKLSAWAAPTNSKESLLATMTNLAFFPSFFLQWNSQLFPDTYNIQLFAGKKYASYSVFRPLTVPPLYHWLCKLKNTLVSKFTLYFYKILSQQTSSSEMKSICSHATTDYYQKIVTFQKRTDAYCVALVLNTVNLESYRGHGYQYPGKPYESPKGLDSYPAILSYPIEQPILHWPCIVMIMNDKSWDSSSSDDVICFYDKNLQTTYFLARIDQYMTVVVIIQSKRSEKEGLINNFLHELCIQLRCNKVFAALKPGSK